MKLENIQETSAFETSWEVYFWGKIDLQEIFSRTRNLLSFHIDLFPNYLFTAILSLNESNLAQTFAFAFLFAIILLFKNIKRSSKEVFSSPERWKLNISEVEKAPSVI